MNAFRISSTFTPHTFDELMAPFREYATEYKEVEAQYADLLQLTEAWKDIANRDKSPEAYNMYRRYSDLLKALANDFSQGMNPNNRRAYLGLKAGYSREIQPIADAHKAMVEANKFRDEKGNDAIFRKSRYNSIDQFLHGRTADNKYESRQDIINRTSAMITNLMQASPKDLKISSTDNKYFLKSENGYVDGFDKESLQAVLGDNWEAALQRLLAGDQNEFARVKLNMLKQLGYSGYDYEGRQALEGAVDTGLHYGLQKVSVSDPLRDPGTPSAYEEANIALGKRNAAVAEREVTLREKQFKSDQEDKQFNRELSAGIRGIKNPDGTITYQSPYVTTTLYPETLKKGDYYIDATMADGTPYIKRVNSGTPGAKQWLYNSPLKVNVYKPDSSVSRVTQDDLNRAKLEKGVTFSTMNDTEKSNYLTTLNLNNGMVRFFKSSKGDAHTKVRASGRDRWTGGTDSDAGFWSNGVDKLKGDGKKEVLQYVGELFGISDLTSYDDDLKQTILDKAKNAVSVYRNHDWGSDSHFALMLNGMSFDKKTGKSSIENKNKAEVYASYETLAKAVEQVVKEQNSRESTYINRY